MDPVTYALAKNYTDERGLFSKFDATGAPGINNDNTEGYAPGSLWVDVTNNKVYVCKDASTGAAEWVDMEAPGGNHAATHEESGIDELDVTDLSGLLADAQTPLTHAADHEDGGADEINLDGLAGTSTELETHKLDSMPHQFSDGGTDYRYGFNQEDGHLVFMYEEVV